jgi:hypothetical protein
MAKRGNAPIYVRAANVLTTTLLRAGVKLEGAGKYPLYLLTVRGRKSGLPRTFPLAIWKHEEKRYIGSAAEEAVLTRGRHSETFSVIELPKSEAAFVLREDIQAGNPFARSYGVTADSSLEEFERAVLTHPVFFLEKKVQSSGSI